MTGAESALLGLLEVEGRLLAAGSRAELAFIAVNEIHGLLPYRQAALWSPRQGMEALSGVAVVERKAPFLLWLEPVLAHLAATHPPASPPQAAVLDGQALPSALAEAWNDWLPPCALFLAWPGGALLLARDLPWEEGELLLLSRLGQAVAAVWRGFDPPSAWGRLRGLRQRTKAAALAVGLAGLGAWPVTGSVLAPAEMVPARPALVRAPLDGVVDKLHVQPNDPVREGQPLFDLDDTTLRGKRDVAWREYATAEAEYRQAAQAQVFDPKAKSQVAILKSRMEEKAAEGQWLDSQIARIRVKAPRSGIAILDDPAEWIGRPVAVGEKVMQVADETDTEVEAWVAVADAGEVRPGSRLTLFLNTAPLRPRHALVRSLAYEAMARPDGSLAHRLRARLEEEGAEKPRLGLKGTARIDGERIPLAWWLFRRPVTALRQMLGF